MEDAGLFRSIRLLQKQGPVCGNCSSSQVSQLSASKSTCFRSPILANDTSELLVTCTELLSGPVAMNTSSLWFPTVRAMEAAAVRSPPGASRSPYGVPKKGIGMCDQPQGEVASTAGSSAASERDEVS